MDTKDELIKIVETKNFSDAPEDLEKHAKDHSFEHPIRPRYIIRPDTVDQVQKTAKWANDSLTPLIPVSSGPPHFRGDTVPSAGGAVIVDLERMNQIVRIDEEHRIAMVEPGVKFADLIPELEKNGLRLNMPLLPRASKSVVGSLLEREPVMMPRFHWDNADPLACTEVIYGNGDLFRTGSSAGPGTIEEQWEAGAAQNEAAGPVQADFYRLLQGAQGTMGIVTWATVRCEMLPSMEEPFFIGSPNLENLLEFCHWGIRRKLIEHCLVLNHSNLATIMAKQWPEDYAKIKKSLPPYVLFLSLAGYAYFPEERIAYQKEATVDIAKPLQLNLEQVIGEVSASDFLNMLRNPCPEPFWKQREKGSCHDLFFMSTAENLTELINVMHGMADQYGYPVSSTGIYIQPVVQGVSYHCEFNLFFDPDDVTETRMVKELSMAATEALANSGAFFSRPYGYCADIAFRRDAQSTVALRKVKQIFDPNNIMNPGKLCF